MEGYRRRASDARPWLREPWWIEIGSGLAAALWGAFAVALGFHLMVLSSLKVLLSVAPEWVWQSGGLCIGLTQMAVALMDRPIGRWIMSIVAFGWWLLLLLAFGAAWHTPSIALYFVLAVLNLVPAFRLLPARFP